MTMSTLTVPWLFVTRCCQPQSFEIPNEKSSSTSLTVQQHSVRMQHKQTLQKHPKDIASLWWNLTIYISLSLSSRIMAIEKPPTRCSGSHGQGIQGIQRILGSCDRHPRSPKAPHIPPDAPRFRLSKVPNCSFWHSRNISGRLTLNPILTLKPWNRPRLDLDLNHGFLLFSQQFPYWSYWP